MNYRKVLRFPKFVLSMIVFLTRNLKKSVRIQRIPCDYFADVEFCPCSRDLVTTVDRLYEVFHDGKKLGTVKKIMLKLAGEKLCLVVKDNEDIQTVGYSLYYFNSRDIRERTVHEGDTGLLPEYRGCGIGTAQRLHALQHFARCPFIQGVSSRVSLNNLASLKSNLNLGFEEKERYYDQTMGEERVYLVCDLAPYREGFGSGIIDESPEILERENS